uniref:Cytochrome c biogenesis protein CcsB n=1 Tax=Oscillatoriales cyanobacterium SpSt-402 TaxID=2282168 RepID=A0A832H0A4_9CYAN
MTAKDELSSKLVKIGRVPQIFFKREVIPFLADLRLAIALLLVIALFSISGTVIEQGQTLAFYQTNYPENPALFGFLTWKMLLILGLDHVYRTWWFLALLILFGSSLTACTFKRQLPALRWFSRTWNFYTQPRQFQKFTLSAEFNHGSIEQIIPLLEQRRYRIFRQDNSLYAHKGIMGRIGPIVVHVGILVILLGGIAGAMTGFMAQEMIPSGQTFQIKNITDAGPFAAPQVPKDWSVKINRFWIDYLPDGNIDQFYSDMSVLDQDGKEVKRKTIHVNEPLRYRGVTLYQANWAIAGIRVRLNNSPIFQLPMAPLDTGGKGQIWGTWMPTKPDLSDGVSLVAKDLQGMVLVYDMTGKLVSTVRAGMSTEVNGITLKVLDLIGSTGLQIKADPGIPLVYTGFALLMLGVSMSYVSHSQIWVLQQAGHCYIGGRTNRAQVTFEREMLDLFNQLEQQGETKPAIAI